MTAAPLTDEDINAVLDGEAAEALVARVEADPVARDRLTALRTARDALRSAPRAPLDPAVVDTLITRAMTEGQRPQAADDAAPATVTPLAPPRSSPTTGPRWLAAAAIVVLVAVGLALVWSGTRTSDETTASIVPSQPEADGSGTESDRADAPDAENGDFDSESSETSASPNTTVASGAFPPTAGEDPFAGGVTSDGPVDLGAFENVDDLRAALRDTFPSGRTSTAAIAGNDAAIERCDLLMQEVFSLPEPARAVGIASVAGTDLIVYEYEAPPRPDGSPMSFVTANEPSSCSAELSFERTEG